MSDDYSRPGWAARWGWIWAAISFAGGIPNMVLLAMDPSWKRAGLVLFTIVATSFCVWMWRRTVKYDRERRAAMARIAAWRWPS